MSKTHEQRNNFALDRSLSAGTWRGDKGNEWRIGYIVTPLGVVGTYEERRSPFTTLTVSKGYRAYKLHIDRVLTQRGLVRAARKFAGETLR